MKAVKVLLISIAALVAAVCWTVAWALATG